MYMINCRFQFAYLVKCAQFIKYCTPSEKMFDDLPHVIYSAKAHSVLRCSQRKLQFHFAYYVKDRQLVEF
jgi:hypothetical protein